jgi:GH43 family beta-xylosidase
LAEDGETVLMIYHACDYQGLQGTPLTDRHRHIYVRKQHWIADGMPDFRRHQSDSDTFLD